MAKVYSKVYTQILKFKSKYPGTISWRLIEHVKIADKHLNPNEKVLYAFAAQKNDKWYDLITTCVVVITDKRLFVAQKRVLFGYFFTSITPDLFNDLKAKMGLVWGKIIIDTLKETVILSNVSKKALPEIESAITKYIMSGKKKLGAKKK